MDERSQRPSNFGLLVLLVLSILAGSLIFYGRVALRQQMALASPGGQVVPSSMVGDGPLAIIGQGYAVIRDAFVKKVDPMVLVEGALTGMAKATQDPYTTYYNPEQLRSFTERTDGTYSGIGSTIELKDSVLTIVSPMEGSPSQKAGLRTGDQIIKVDGKELKNITLEEGVAKVKGPAGTTVVLTVRRPGVDEPFDVGIVRASIVSPTVSSRMLEDKIGYIAMSQFAETTTAQFDKALADLRAQGMKGLVLDLRNNGGGRLDTCLEIANRLVPKGPVVHRVDREGRKVTEYSKLEKRDFPMAVLINNYSASASEIIAGALQDTKSATIVGVRSFGKASVQRTYPLDNGGALKVTIEDYLTPNEQHIQGVGIQPDIKVLDPLWPLLPASPDESAAKHTEDDIELMQAKLRALGYAIAASEQGMGPQTTAALKSFQGTYELTASGKLNDETRDGLNQATIGLMTGDLQLAKAVEAVKGQVGR